MSAGALTAYRVQLHRRGGKFKGHVDVQATCEKHAERVAVKQVIEVSYPKSKPGQWVVDGVEAKGGVAC
jgi:hypothetical protein